MLIATPYRDFDVRDRRPPKVISEVRKTYLNSAATNSRPKLSAELLVKCNTEKNWHHRRVQIRGGLLYVSSTPGEQTSTAMRLPLRHLSLQAGPQPNSIAICRGSNIVLTLQTVDKKSFDQWVKILAIELIRQTPLDAIKYLDILTLAECWTKTADPCPKDWNFNNITQTKTSPSISYDVPDSPRRSTRIPDWPESPAVSPVKSPSQSSENTEEVIETLLKKCQNVETYVPVKEKLFLFESLCKMGRKVRSSEDVSSRVDTTAITKRAKSCHDLSNIQTHIAVREICKYFEHRGGDEKDRSITEQKNIGGLRHLRFQKSVTT